MGAEDERGTIFAFARDEITGADFAGAAAGGVSSVSNFWSKSFNLELTPGFACASGGIEYVGCGLGGAEAGLPAGAP